LIDTANPIVEQAVSGILPSWRAITPDVVSRCRKQATVRAFEQAGFAFLNYQSLKLHALAERLANLGHSLRRKPEWDSPGRAAAQPILQSLPELAV
jgi:hypothetical protein